MVSPDVPAGESGGGSAEVPVGAGAARQSGPAIPSSLPLLPVRNAVVLPGTIVPLGIGREKSKRLMDAVLATENKLVAIVAQKRPDVEEPGLDDLYRVGCVCAITKLLRMPDGSQHAIAHGLVRARIEQLVQEDPFLAARITPVEDRIEESTELSALAHNVRQAAQRVIELSPNVPDEAVTVLNSIDHPGALADFVAANLPMPLPDRQDLLETLDVAERLRKVHAKLIQQIDVLELSKQIHDQAREQIEKAQREYFLQEQLKAIQREAMRELSRMERIPQASPEYSVSRDYVDWLCELPWAKSTEDNLDIDRAAKILDDDHYDLDNVKKRILQFLAVKKLKPTGRGPILCFVGPPGVGKTSLGQSIARALGRKFIRMSLGGMRDEADIRGHRRTYIGALPGRIMQEMRKAGSNNPVFMLDEVDKIGVDFRGDPAAALLEVLDPEQNHAFVDHYLAVPFDLSKVLFISTANWTDPIPAPLRDRMEMIEIPGYTLLEKMHIARKYLIPRQLDQHGLNDKHLEITDEALEQIVQHYTREAGVRNLERQIAAICRCVAAAVARGRTRKHRVTGRNLANYLGPARFLQETALRAGMPGVVTGLAFTPTGGEIIFIEATIMPGKGNLLLTGHIGDVMRESSQAAFSLVRSRGQEWGIDPTTLADKDIHIHVPAGAVPKDGPSAGVAMFTALVSLLTNTPARADVAMTGEITLRGAVLPIGGVKEKVLAAHRAGIKAVVLPEQNRKDMEEVHEDIRKSLEFVFVKRIDQVLEAALEQKPAARKGPKMRHATTSSKRPAVAVAKARRKRR